MKKTITKIEKPKVKGTNPGAAQHVGWRLRYYSPSAYLLIMTGAVLFEWLAGYAANFARSLAGLLPYHERGFDVFLLKMMAVLLLGINIVYALALMIAGYASKHQRLKAGMYNVGVVIIVLSALFIAIYAFIIAYNAPNEGYPQWNF